MFHMNPLPNPHLKSDWTDLFASTNRVFTDDFCHLDGLTYGVQGQSSKGTQFAFAESLYFRDNWQVLDRLRLRFPIFTSKIVEGYLNNERVGISFNHGLSMVFGKPFFFYGGVGANRNGSQPHFKFGVWSNHTNCVSDNRLRVLNDLTITYYHKTILNIQAFKLGFLGVFNFTETKLEKKDFFIGYNKDKFNVSLKGFQAWNRPTKNWNNFTELFSNVSLTGVFARNENETYGLELSVDPSNPDSKEASFLVDYYQSRNERVKAKVNTFSVITLLLQKKFNDQVSLSLGASFPIHKTEGRRRTRTGMRLFFNV